eukprot:6207687-Pleurochrysis_carterae.AAC.1
MLEPLRPLFDEMLTALVISDSLAAKTEEGFEPSVRFGGGALSVPGSTPGRREYLGRVDVRAGAGPVKFFTVHPKTSSTDLTNTWVLELFLLFANLVVRPSSRSTTSRRALCSTSVSLFPAIRAQPIRSPTMSYDWDTETLSVYDIVICPGMGNPTYPSVDAALAAYNDGSLKLCSIDGEWYGDTKAHMDPEPPYFIDDAAAKRAEPMIYYPE